MCQVCQKKGALYHINTSFSWKLFNKKRNLRFFSIPRKEWRRLYSDAHSKENFKKWLKWTLFTQKKNLLLAYNTSPLTGIIGLYTFRYLRLYINDFLSLEKKLSTKEEVLDLERNHNFLDAIIRQENLEGDLIEFLKNQEVTEDNDIIDIMKLKVNASQHLHYLNYYDKESMKWIEDMDQEEEKVSDQENHLRI